MTSDNESALLGQQAPVNGAAGAATCALTANRRLASNATENKRRVDAAESKVVRHQVFDLDSTRLAHDVVERRATLIDHVEIGIRREASIAHHLDAEPGLDGATGAQRMAEIALQRMDRLARAEHRLRRLRFGDVTPLRGGAMAVDEANRIGRQAGIVE